MSALPRTSPWGEVQHCEKLIDGVFLVSTAGHGGVMVRKNASDFLSPEARRIGLNERNYLSFEEDCEEQVVLYELLEKRLWELPERIADKTGYVESIMRSLMRWQPEYWEKRGNPLATHKDGSPGSASEIIPDTRRDIIFRDADYKEKFRIKDGDSIKITVAYDGEEIIRKCRWLDEAHMNVGSTCFHMDEFMEKQTRVGNKYEPVPHQEPKLDVLIVEPGKPPHNAEIVMSLAAMSKIVGGTPEIVGINKDMAIVNNTYGNGTFLICGMSDGQLTSLHPYAAQMKKRELENRVAARNEPDKLTLADRLETGKAKAAEHNAAGSRAAYRQRHAEMG